MKTFKNVWEKTDGSKGIGESFVKSMGENFVKCMGEKDR